MSLNYSIKPDTVTFIVKGKAIVVQKGAANFLNLRQALLDEDEERAMSFLTIAKVLEDWAKGDFTVRNGAVLYQGEALPTELNSRICATAAKGEDPTYLMKFWELLKENPSCTSVEQAYSFMTHCGIAINEAGFIVAYKAVTSDFLDFYTKKIGNKPGSLVKMPRNQISDNPNTPCHKGLHVGALDYADKFGEVGRRIVICLVNPKDVVCVPYDYSAQKMRVCEYFVLGLYGSRLPSTNFSTKAETDILACDPAKAKEDQVAPVVPAEEAKAALDLNTFLDGLDEIALLQEDTERLRSYAARHLHIVGASKIPGGRRALVNRILEVRR